MTATEKCSCGATFSLAARNESAVLIALKQWREKHPCSVRAQSQESERP